MKYLKSLTILGGRGKICFEKKKKKKQITIFSKGKFPSFVSYKAFGRTAQATPGLINIQFFLSFDLDHESKSGLVPINKTFYM